MGSKHLLVTAVIYYGLAQTDEEPRNASLLPRGTQPYWTGRGNHQASDVRLFAPRLRGPDPYSDSTK
jgi:hypothetical protein